MTLSLVAAFIGGIFACAGWEHRKARLDHAVLCYLIEYGETKSLSLRHEFGSSIYVRLARLLDWGWVTKRIEEGGPERMGIPCHWYSIADAGRAAVAAEMSRWTKGERHVR